MPESIQDSEMTITDSDSPRDDRSVITDANGEKYIIGCTLDTNLASNNNTRAVNGFNDCFAVCEFHADCDLTVNSGTKSPKQAPRRPRPVADSLM